MSPAIGIDLGTSSSFVSVCRGGRTETVLVDGRAAMPSVISVCPGGEVLVGSTAKARSSTEPAHTIASPTRFIGDEETTWEIFGKTYTPTDVCAIMMERLKEAAERHLAESVSNAVIAVPAYLTNQQRDHMMRAGELAGLNVLRILPAPTAAAIHYGLDKRKNQTLLVYDLGGGTFDVSVVKVERHEFSVVAVKGDSHLGGDDFDQCLVEYLIGLIEKQTIEEQTKKDMGLLRSLSGSKKKRQKDDETAPRDVLLARQRLKEAAETAKIELSQCDRTCVSLPDILGTSLDEEITIDTYNRLIDPMVARTIEKIREVLASARLSTEDIDQVILVGGSSRNRLVKEQVTTAVKEPWTSEPVDEVVAMGAALMADGLSLPETDMAQQPPICVTDVAPFSVGVRPLDRGDTDRFEVFIPKNARLPTAVERKFSTDQSPVDIDVFLGEHSCCRDNMFIGRLRLEGIAVGRQEITIRFAMEASGLLTVTAACGNLRHKCRFDIAQPPKPSSTGWRGETTEPSSLGQVTQPSAIETTEPSATGQRRETTEPSSLGQVTQPSAIETTEPSGVGPSRSVETTEPASLGQPGETTEPVHLDENVQFTVYRPKMVRPNEWYDLLAFAHLSERRPDAPKGEPDPIQQVRDIVSRRLGPAAADYQDLTQDSRQAVPRQGELTFVPEMDGVEFNPNFRTFRWTDKSVHKEEFEFRAAARPDGMPARGRMTVFLGSILLAEVTLSIRVDPNAQPKSRSMPAEEIGFSPYRRIFASYSHLDAAIVEQHQRYAEQMGLGDRYLRDCVDLQPGEVWSRRLEELIEESDIFQLFWSSNSMRSPFVKREWEYALALGRTSFVRPTYWEEPFPQRPDLGLPPQKLRDLHFKKIGGGWGEGVAASHGSPGGGPDEDSRPPANEPSGTSGSPGESAEARVARLQEELERLQAERDAEISELRAKLEVLNARQAGQDEMERQLDLARRIQHHVEGPRLNVSGVDTAIEYCPAMSVGGDYCDVWAASDDRVAFALADVSQHGLPAALVSTSLQSAVRMALATCADLEEVARRVNASLCDQLADSFVVILLGYYSPSDGSLAYVNAGQVGPWHLAPPGSVTTLQDDVGMPMGIQPFEYKVARRVLAPGEGLVLVSDGVTEATSPEGEQFGVEGVEKVLAQVGGTPAKTIARTVVEKVRDFLDGPQRDDISVLVLVNSGRDADEQCPDTGSTDEA